MGSNLRISSLVESNRGLILAPVPGRVELVPPQRLPPPARDALVWHKERPIDPDRCEVATTCCGPSAVRWTSRPPSPPRRPAESRSWLLPQTAQVSALQTCRVRWRATSPYTRGPMVAANGR